MELNEIEHKIACNEMSAAQVFTQMKQHVESPLSPGCSKADTELFKKIHNDLLLRANMAADDRGDNDIVVDLSGSVWSLLKKRIGR